MISPFGGKVAGGIITTVAGNGTSGYSGDAGNATSAELNEPWGVAVDISGNVYVSDTFNNRIRRLTPTATGPPASPSTRLPPTRQSPAP